MNKERRKKIDDVRAALEELQNAEVFSAAKESISEMAEEEREYYDNMPEGLQSGEKGSAAEQAADALEAAGEALDAALESLGESVDNLNEALEV